MKRGVQLARHAPRVPLLSLQLVATPPPNIYRGRLHPRHPGAKVPATESLLAGAYLIARRSPNFPFSERNLCFSPPPTEAKATKSWDDRGYSDRDSATFVAQLPQTQPE